jgi:membrane protein implicated in regulation of membrane protease activity
VSVTDWVAKHRIWLGCAMLAVGWFIPFAESGVQVWLEPLIIIVALFLIVLWLSNLRTDRPTPPLTSMPEKLLVGAAIVSFVVAAYVHYAIDDGFKFMGIIMAQICILNMRNLQSQVLDKASTKP